MFSSPCSAPRSSAGEPSATQDQPLTINRHGYVEEVFFTWSSSPICGEHGIGGVFTTIAETVRARPAHRSNLSHGRILIADEDADTRDYVRRALAPSWQVEIAADIGTAVEIMRAGTPDLVVSGMDGLLQRLRADPSLSHVPVLGLSAEPSDAVAGDDYLAKPFSARELLARVGNLLELAAMRTDAQIIQNISSQLTSELDLDRLLQLITDEATKLVGAEFGSFFYNVTDENGESHKLYTLSGVSRDVFAGSPMPRTPRSSRIRLPGRASSVPTTSSSIHGTATTRRITASPRAMCR